jgi:hypothetical protein
VGEFLQEDLAIEDKLFMKFNLPYSLYRVYAKLESHYYAFKDSNNAALPSIVCQICDEPGHVERLCPNVCRMGFQVWCDDNPDVLNG